MQSEVNWCGIVLFKSMSAFVLSYEKDSLPLLFMENIYLPSPRSSLGKEKQEKEEMGPFCWILSSVTLFLSPQWK